jgi:hypothetical protein
MVIDFFPHRILPHALTFRAENMQILMARFLNAS